MNGIDDYLRAQLSLTEGDQHVQCLGYYPEQGTKVNAALLKGRVEQMKQQLGVTKVHIVAHSFGGLVSRYYIEKLGGAPNVASLTMLGTPNLGVGYSKLLESLCNTTSGSLLAILACAYGALDGAAADMDECSPLLRELNQDPGCDGAAYVPPGGVQYRVLAGTAGRQTKDKYYKQPNDCVVNLPSASGPGGIWTAYQFPVFHTTGFCSSPHLLNDASVKAAILSSIQSAGGSGSVASTVLPQNGGSSDNAISAGAISQSQSVTQTAQLESQDPVDFALYWLGDDSGSPPLLRLTLESPSGSMITASGPGVTYYQASQPTFGGLMTESYALTSPEIGEWTLHVEGLQVPAEGLDYLAVTTTDSEITLSSALDEPSYLVGAPIRIEAALTSAGAPVTNATVTAQVERPDGTSAITLVDNGTSGDKVPADGIYSALFTDTSACGVYEFLVSATGSGGTFTRSDLLLTNVHVTGDDAGDPCVADDDGDSCPDNREQGTSQLTGGLRSPYNPNDYFNPSHDGQNRVDDILAVVYQYHVDAGNPAYNPDTDRTLVGPNAWNLGPPDGLQRVDDILNSVKQYFHDCS